MEKKKSQVVFDEVGYNLSNEAKRLIYSLDDTKNSVENVASENLIATISELEADKKNLEREVERLRTEIRNFKEADEEPDSQSPEPNDGESDGVD